MKICTIAIKDNKKKKKMLKSYKLAKDIDFFI